MKVERIPPDRRLIADSLLRWQRGRLHGWIDRRPAQVLLLIMLLALLLGIAKLWLDPPNIEWELQNRWWQIALNVARGEGYTACKAIYFPFCDATNQVTAMREPVPVLVFASIALLTKESLFAAAAFEVIVNLAILVAIFYLGREVANTRVGLVAALLWSIYLAPIRLFYSQVSGDLMATLGVTCGLIYFLRARRTNRPHDWLIAGVWIGLAILSRSAVIVIALALTAGSMFWPNARGEMSRRSYILNVGTVAMFVIAWGLIISPWIVRNYVAFGRPVIGSTLAGYYLYRQNYMLPTDNYLRFVSGGEFMPVLQATLAQRPDLQGTENEAQMDSIYREEALRVIAAEPLRYVALSAYRFLMLWFNWGVNEVYGARNTVGDYLIALQHALLLGAGVLGLRRRWPHAWPLAVSVVAFSLLYMAVQAHVPYIVPVMPFLVVLSAVTCIRGGRRLSTTLSQAMRGSNSAGRVGA
jgi:hypothetical protein